MAGSMRTRGFGWLGLAVAVALLHAAVSAKAAHGHARTALSAPPLTWCSARASDCPEAAGDRTCERARRHFSAARAQRKGGRAAKRTMSPCTRSGGRRNRPSPATRTAAASGRAVKHGGLEAASVTLYMLSILSLCGGQRGHSRRTTYGFCARHGAPRPPGPRCARLGTFSASIARYARPLRVR
jgi:hypothetical protein